MAPEADNAAMIAARITVKQNRLQRVAGNIGNATEQRRREVIRRTIAYARGFARVDTGYMRDHVIETNDGVESMAHYSAPNEYGTRYMSAQPFMRPAIAQATAEIVSIFGGFEADITSGTGGGFGDAAGRHIGRVPG